MLDDLFSVTLKYWSRIQTFRQPDSNSRVISTTPFTVWSVSPECADNLPILFADISPAPRTVPARSKDSNIC